MIDDQNTIWEVFHGKDLDRLVDKAHNELPYAYDIQTVDVKKFGGEFVVIVLAKISRGC